MGKESNERVQGVYASSSLFPMLGIKPILGRTFVPEEDQYEGRFFTETDGRDTPRVASSMRAARRYWPAPGGFSNPIGQRLVIGGGERIDRIPKTGGTNWRQIVGVVGDVRGAGLDAKPRPEIYMPYWQWPWHEATLVVRSSGDPAGLAAATRSEVRALNKNAVVTRVRTMEQIVADSVAQPRFRTLILGLFSAMALLLAAVGIHGVMSYSVAQRTQEIGIRMALGAQPRDLLRTVLGQSLKLSAAGVAIGLPGAAVLTRVIASQLYGVTATDPGTLGGVSLLLIVVALVASYMPARRALRVDPMVALKVE